MQEIPKVFKPDWRYWRFLSGGMRSAAPLLASVLLGWEIFGRLLELRTDLLPTPSRIALELWQQSPTLLAHSIPTFASILAAWLMSILLAIPIGFWVGASSKAYRKARALLSFLLRTPLVALAPLVVVWFGFGALPNLLVPFFLSLILVTTSIADGRHRMSLELVALMDTTGAGTISRILKVHGPATMPFLLRGLRTAINWVIVSVLVVELLGSENGLGFILMGATAKYNTPLVFAILTILTAMGGFLYLGVKIAEDLLIPWYPEMEKHEFLTQDTIS